MIMSPLPTTVCLWIAFTEYLLEMSHMMVLILLICLFLLDLGLLWIFKVFLGMILALPLILGLPIALWDSPRSWRLGKLLLVPWIVLFIIIPKPWTWPTECLRRIDRGRIIQPNDPSVAQVEQEFWAHLEQAGLRMDWDRGDAAKRLDLLMRFVLKRVSYSYDFPNWGVFCHTATPEEAIRVKGKDDCQGQACVAVSLMQRLGYEAYCAETPFHWYVAVSGEPGEDWIFLNRGTATDPLTVFHQDVRRYPWSSTERPAEMSSFVLEVFESRHNKILFEPLRKSLVERPALWPGSILLLGCVSAVWVFFLHWPERRGSILCSYPWDVVWMWGCLCLCLVVVWLLAGSPKGIRFCIAVSLFLFWWGTAGADRSWLFRLVCLRNRPSARLETNLQ